MLDFLLILGGVAMGIVILFAVFVAAAGKLTGIDKNGRIMGQYLGTEIDRDWKRRYTETGWLARGNGVFWWDESGFHFSRYMSDNPLFIPKEKIVAVESGTKHSGRWAYGNKIVKIVWRHNGQPLSSGFIVGNKRDAVAKITAQIVEWSRLTNSDEP